MSAVKRGGGPELHLAGGLLLGLKEPMSARTPHPRAPSRVCARPPSLAWFTSAPPPDPQQDAALP